MNIPMVVRSPNYPNPYPPNVQVTWTLNGEEGSILQGTFSSFDLVAPGDYLEIYDTMAASNRVRRAAAYSSILLHLTGPESTLLNTTFQTSGNAITLMLVSDAEFEGTGFSLVLTPVHKQGNKSNYNPVNILK